MFKKIILLSLLVSSSLFSNTINIAVAANVSYAIDTLTKEFNKIYPNIKVRVILGSSGKLTAQIKHGAPYGLFMSANMKYPNALYEDQIAITKPFVYAQGSLAYFSTQACDFSKGVEILKNKNISRIAIANPKTAPYGKAAKEALENANIYNDIKKKFIFGESISQTVSYAVAAADIGLIAKSSLFSSKMAQYKKDINWCEVDSTLYTPINQGMVILKNNKDIEAFYNFILSKKAKKIFEDFGYRVP
ncbi:MAG: molybdate ABC transporter substrate-binding protein [Campylobacteraceae bacterium]|jgi:molybdate transport system substrate-binding protein|nr:molybdate ABC transporter substrate-binding protein [Campylobacteraceae bacterium]MBT3881731.1 molybdate ABC transporter substrate-binding protein [Campylobacteraceae bacterium]MBT4179343.1 molybdate ABC transporter substrate-binding protein [Campylobacteraceae bacterium]MBT4573111.1 molybdate ABC transporter substrate-binding protein [Campylobacteraceae bacterium]MBT5324007.1 molybdate ABC transporter substrate-binding protein [Campylobacteraceae bacterium]